LPPLFLTTHYGFWQYSQKIMSEVPSVFLLTSVLALVLSVHEEHPTIFRYVAAGAVLGFAVTVRYDNVLWVVPAAALLLGVGPRTERWRRVGSAWLAWRHGSSSWLFITRSRSGVRGGPATAIGETAAIPRNRCSPRSTL